MKRRKTIFLALVMVATFLTAGNEKMLLRAAQKQPQSEAGSVLQKEVLENEDPLNDGNGGNNNEASFEAKDETGVTTFSKKSAAGSSAQDGIDVSSKNGTINWTTARDAGVEFALIRVGLRGFKYGTLASDSNYVTNITGALNAGIPVGVYFFSQAITPAEAKEEAEYITNAISGYNITLPVTMDYEYIDGPSGRLYDAHLSKADATTIVNTFCSTVQEKGYTPMLYANKDMLTNHLNASAIADKYKVWLANYTVPTTYTGTYTFWQYSSSGKGATYGCTSESVDLDKWYMDAVPMFRLYNPNSGEHFYTADQNERNVLIKAGWSYENVGWYAPTTGNPVYRVYNPNAGDHHYTMSAGERDNLTGLGWVYEGIAFYSDVNCQVPLYRTYNPNARSGTHNYTKSVAENNNLISLGWSNEGIGWYGVN